MTRYLRITVVMTYLLTCLWVGPSHAANGSRMKVSLTGIVVSEQAISKADAATLTNRFRAELARSSAFEVVAAADADLTVTGGISRQDTTYTMKVEVQTLKTGKSAAVEARYSVFTDLISDFTRNLPGLVNIRLEQTARGLAPTAPTKKTSKAIYVVLGAVVAGGGGAVVALLSGKGGGSSVNIPPPPPSPGSISFTITVP